MKNTPIERHLIDETINEFQIVDFSKATIREVKAIASKAETASGVEFIKMEMGVPGLPPSAVGVKAEIEALQNGIASLYPDINGLPELKKEASNFIKAFINVDLSPEGCVPVTGSMQGTFASFLTCSQCDEKKDTILFIDPGFPVQKQQLVVMGQKFETFDVYDYRGEKLKEKLESYLKKGNISAIIYSNPNNPSWICLKEEELRIIGKLATLYDVIVLEDLAYFAMDFRQDLSKPYQPPFQPSVAHYTDNYVLLISGSKAFSSSCPASAAMVMVVSCPTMWKATWLTTSGMTGFTLPGMMEDPFCFAGRLISPNPVFGPEDISRRSLHILERSTAQVFTTPDTATKPSRFSVASKRSSACFNG